MKLNFSVYNKILWALRTLHRVANPVTRSSQGCKPTMYPPLARLIALMTSGSLEYRFLHVNESRDSDGNCWMVEND